MSIISIMSIKIEPCEKAEGDLLKKMFTNNPGISSGNLISPNSAKNW